MKINQIAEFKCCLTCVYHKLYPPTNRDGQVVFHRYLCGLSMDSSKEVVRPEEVCACWKGVTLGIE